MKRYIADHKNYDVFQGGKHHGPKYNSNPVLKWLNNGFMDSLLHFVEESGSKAVFEIGCGEGQLMGMLHDRGYDVAGMDYDEESVQLSKENFKNANLENISITQGNLFDLTPEDPRIKGRMPICCEVLEHVENPEKGIEIIANATTDYFILSVPHEPLWRILNFMRGKYMKDFGNTPGHINHWTKKGFIKAVSKYAEVVAYSTPLPWTMLLCRRKNNKSASLNR